MGNWSAVGFAPSGPTDKKLIFQLLNNTVGSKLLNRIAGYWPSPHGIHDSNAELGDQQQQTDRQAAGACLMQVRQSDRLWRYVSWDPNC